MRNTGLSLNFQRTTPGYHKLSSYWNAAYNGMFRSYITWLILFATTDTSHGPCGNVFIKPISLLRDQNLFALILERGSIALLLLASDTCAVLSMSCWEWHAAQVIEPDGFTQGRSLMSLRITMANLISITGPIPRARKLTVVIPTCEDHYLSPL